jgi:hypothetical protein
MSFINIIASSKRRSGIPPEPAWLIKQDFEGVGYDNGETWVQGGGSGIMDPDYTTDPISGAESLQISGSSSTNVFSYYQFTDKGAFYVRMRCRIESADSIFASMRSSATTRATLSINSGKLRVLVGGGSNVNSLNNIPIATNIYIWFEFEKGTGSNAIARASFSLNSTKPDWSSGDACVSSGGNVTADVNRLYLGSTTAVAGNTIFDEIRGFDSSFL